MKKVISVFLTLALVVSFASFALATLKGDVDGDGKITASDARSALRFSVALDVPTAEQKIAADYNSDGEITASDARSILRKSVGLEDDVNKPNSDIKDITGSDAEDTTNSGTEDPSKPKDYGPKNPYVNNYTPSARELKFYETLFETAHPLLGKTKPGYNNMLMKNFQKWCCYYTIVDVFRPALEKAGYPEKEIDLLAPTKFSKDSIAKALSSVTGTKWPSWFVVDSLDLLIPSLLADYYIKNSQAADTFFFHDFFDDIVEQKVYERTDNVQNEYVPRIGDVLFISNKTKTYENGYPTVDHTAQIIKVMEDGTFFCTEGSLLGPEGDGLARVRERKYRYNETEGTYEYINKPDVVVLFAAQPKLK